MVEARDYRLKVFAQQEGTENDDNAVRIQELKTEAELEEAIDRSGVFGLSEGRIVLLAKG